METKFTQSFTQDEKDFWLVTEKLVFGYFRPAFG